MNCCAYCYKPAEKLFTCGKCHKRKFCSRDCQKAYWKNAGHNFYCGVAGEIGFDFEIRKVSDQIGLGIFALKDFQKDDTIMAERPLLHWKAGQRCLLGSHSVPDSAREAIAALVPAGGTFLQKLNRNCMACTSDDDDNEGGLFVHMSRANHDCLANADHGYHEHRGVKILVAARANKGEEVTISYVGIYKALAQRQMRLRVSFGFHCNCTACSDTNVEAKLAILRDLDASILNLGSRGEIEAAMRKGRRLIQIYDELCVSSWLYQRTYYDLFQVAITKRKFVSDGIKYIKLAYASALAHTGDDLHPTVESMKNFSQNPSSHRNYLLLQM